MHSILPDHQMGWPVGQPLVGIPTAPQIRVSEWPTPGFHDPGPLDLSIPEPKTTYIAVDTTSGEIFEFSNFTDLHEMLKQEARYSGSPFRVFSVNDEFEVNVKTTFDVTLRRKE